MAPKLHMEHLATISRQTIVQGGCGWESPARREVERAPYGLFGRCARVRVCARDVGCVRANAGGATALRTGPNSGRTNRKILWPIRSLNATVTADIGAQRSGPSGCWSTLGSPRPAFADGYGPGDDLKHLMSFVLETLGRECPGLRGVCVGLFQPIVTSRSDATSDCNHVNMVATGLEHDDGSEGGRRRLPGVS